MSSAKVAGFDRRYLYILLMILVSIPLLSPLGLPIPISGLTEGVWDATVALPAGSVVVHSFDFGPSAMPEIRPQVKAHLFQCKQRGLKVLALAFWASGGPLAHDVLGEVYGEGYETSPEYGTDIVYLGYVPGAEVGMQTFGDNTWAAKGTDNFGTAVADLQLMQEVRSAADFDLWAEWTAGTPGEQQVIQFIQGRHGGPSAVPIIAGSTAVSVPGMMPFYIANQLIGILNGLAGAGEYEWLVNRDYPEYPYEQGPGLDAQSVAHVLVILFVAIGNIAWAISKSRGGGGS